MARGRMITNRIASDAKINQLIDDTSRLAFTWLITFADAEGRTYGDPAMVRSMVFPRRGDVEVDQMQSYIQQWAELGLIYWYEANGDLWIEFVNFKKNQPNLRGDREPASEIPPYDPDLAGQLPDNIQQTSGELPANIPVKLREVKLREEKRREVKRSEVNDDDMTSGVLAELSSVFVSETQIPEMTGGPPRWIGALQKMVDAGITPEDLRAGIRALKKKDYKIAGPWSVHNAAVMEMSSRKAGKSDGGLTFAGEWVS
jgi:hypothetical protein